VTHLLLYIIENVKEYNLKHEIHRFDSGAIMVDIWINDTFYVIQIDKETVGLNLVTKDTTPFDIIPDVSFSDEIQFKKEFAKIFCPMAKPKVNQTVLLSARHGLGKC